MTLPVASRDQWSTTNVFQEALVRGGPSGRNERGRRVTTRPVKAVDADLRINGRLWEMAEPFSRHRPPRGHGGPHSSNQAPPHELSAFSSSLPPELDRDV